MAKLDYCILTVPRRPEYGAVRDDPEGATDTFLVGEAKSFAGHLRVGATVQLDPKHKGSKLDDFIDNKMEWLIVSEKVRALVAAEPNPCEVYPLTVLDLKGRPINAPYFFVHPVGTVDCVDLDESKYERDAMVPDLFLTIERLVLRTERIPPDRTLFRLKESPRTYIVRDDLLDRFAGAGVRGIKVIDLGSEVFV
jgi:hypothetical protein